MYPFTYILQRTLIRDFIVILFSSVLYCFSKFYSQKDCSMTTFTFLVRSEKRLLSESHLQECLDREHHAQPSPARLPAILLNYFTILLLNP